MLGIKSSAFKLLVLVVLGNIILICCELTIDSVSVFPEEMRIYSTGQSIQYRLPEPDNSSIAGPIQHIIKLFKWQSLAIESLPLDLLPQNFYYAGRKSATLRCIKVSLLLFPFHEFW